MGVYREKYAKTGILAKIGTRKKGANYRSLPFASIKICEKENSEKINS